MKPRRIVWSPAELQWIKANKTQFRTDSHRDFVTLFARPDVSFGNYAGLCKRMGWLTGRTKGEGTKGRGRVYCETHRAFIRETATLSRKDGHAAFVARFDLPDMSLAAFVALRKVLKIKTGRTGHFPKGNIPWTAGKKLPFNANSAATQFKAGQVPHNVKFAGHQRLSDDGYIYISVPETNPHTGYERRHVHKHRWLWEQANGPVPDGMVLKCLDGDKTNCDPANWEAIPREMLPRLNGRFGRGYDAASPDVRPAILAVAKLEHKVRTLRKGRASHG